jgi:hypothetical protein
MSTLFKQLNPDWNAEPSEPCPRYSEIEENLLVAFYMNPYQFPAFREGDVGYLRFENCWRYRRGTITHEDWSRGECRFSKLAPAWGEFYEVSGDLVLQRCPNDWLEVGPRRDGQKHFLFYFRDEELEVDADSWTLEVHNIRQEITVERTSGLHGAR